MIIKNIAIEELELEKQTQKGCRIYIAAKHEVKVDSGYATESVWKSNNFVSSAGDRLLFIIC